MNWTGYTRAEANLLINELNLTDDELEIFNLLIKGCSREQIAYKLMIGTRTIDRRIRNIKSKLRKIA